MESNLHSLAEYAISGPPLILQLSVQIKLFRLVSVRLCHYLGWAQYVLLLLLPFHRCFKVYQFYNKGPEHQQGGHYTAPVFLEWEETSELVQA